ncbi:uncharacterized protein LOC128263023 [Drosophila gunungcola]|uniref:BPTI/Kunitz inhibitor domain-containing protein n=1 Tax=Drosophila gunungcola TaxID=103775 RepID=A0A9Q0BT01_9MUSC|nr:uncharacterized protein LOC128263023 [Drosophila gunungcola]KAI8043622.1 hypothetical protein M5D96_004955 [Drosophila gunungcola]
MSRPKPVVLSLLLVVLLLLIHHHHHSADARSVPSIPSICNKPPPRSEGICTIEFEGYFFDPAILDCRMYLVGACHSTPGQSFGSLQDCVSTCVLGNRRNHDLYVNE